VNALQATPIELRCWTTTAYRQLLNMSAKENGPKRSKMLRRENLALEARWKMEGFTIEEITAKINEHNAGLCSPISAMSVYDDLKQCKSMWLSSVVWAQNEMRVSGVQELRRVRRAAWEAFERSKGVARRRSYDTKPDGGGKPVGNVAIYEELRDGDPRWLEKVIQTIVEECRLFGLYPKDPPALGTGDSMTKSVSVAIVLDTGRKTLEEFANFPVRGKMTRPKIIPRPTFHSNGEDRRNRESGG
jgi:hypothetical protein